MSIPIFTAQLNKAKYATDEANARSIYAEMTADYLTSDGTSYLTPNPASVTKGTAATVTTRDGNTYKFSGIVGVTFTAGTSTTAPSVTIDACTETGAAAVTFGATSGSNSGSSTGGNGGN